jgi:hypothetical protein
MCYILGTNWGFYMAEDDILHSHRHEKTSNLTLLLILFLNIVWRFLRHVDLGGVRGALAHTPVSSRHTCLHMSGINIPSRCGLRAVSSHLRVLLFSSC